MFRTLNGRTARGMAVGALVLSLATSALGGSANAAPAAEENGNLGCSVLAHERNDAMHRLHEAWQEFRGELRGLTREARALEREAKKSKSASTMTSEAKAALESANEELSTIRTDAHAQIHEITELGQACKEEQPEPADEDPEITLVSVTDNEDGEVTVVVQFSEPVVCTGDCATLFTYKANEDVTAPAEAADFDLDEDGDTTAQLTFELDEDVEVDTANDELVFKAASGGATLQDEDANDVLDSTNEPVDVSVSTADLVAKYREVVDEAILDMQAVLDGITSAMAEMTEAGETTETVDDATAAAEVEKSKNERAKEKEERAKEFTGRPTDSKGKGNSGKGKGKGRG